MAEYDKIDALHSLGYKFFGGEDVGFTFYDGSGNPIDDEPTDSEIDAEVIRLEAEYTANEYARNRAKSYDSVGDQLDQLMKDMRDGTTTHQTACEAVKAQYPKPE
jgi:hypothetical protein